MISIVIPTYKNRTAFIANMKHNMSYMKGQEIIVVNDFPGESIAAEMKKFPKVNLIENRKNLGFAGAVDIGIRSAGSRHVMLINSDVLLLDKKYEAAVERLGKNKKLFAVSFAQREKDGRIVGKNRFYWKAGFFSHEKAPVMTTGITGWAEGGACMIDKPIYEKIGGFDTLFSPYYWEDIDLSYRAWKEGYEIMFDRNILVEHHHESTIGKYFDQSRIKTIAYRNQFFFIWKNIVDKRLINSHVARVGKSLLPMMVQDPPFVKGLFMALTKLSDVKMKRRQSYTDISDQTIINKFALTK